MNGATRNPMEQAKVALLKLDARELRVALQGCQAPKINKMDPVYWVVKKMVSLSSEQPPAFEDRAHAMLVLETLLQSGANPDGLSNQTAPITALMEASMAGDVPVMRRLLAAKADVNARSAMKNTALHFAAARGSLAGVRLLVEQGADINAQTDSDETPLHWVAKRLEKNPVKGRNVIRELYHLGADFHIPNAFDKTPLDIIAKEDRRLADFWRHKPGRDALEIATPPARNTIPRKPGRL